jgi:hypothetical protein
VLILEASHSSRQLSPCEAISQKKYIVRSLSMLL